MNEYKSGLGHLHSWKTLMGHVKGDTVLYNHIRNKTLDILQKRLEEFGVKPTIQPRFNVVNNSFSSWLEVKPQDLMVVISDISISIGTDRDLQRGQNWHSFKISDPNSIGDAIRKLVNLILFHKCGERR